MNKKLTLEELEDHAFYESGLSAHGCLETLDSYAKTAIKKYGRILLETHLADLIEESNTLKKEISILKQRLNDIKEGFEGCCYACEPVGMLNQELEKELQQYRQKLGK